MVVEARIDTRNSETMPVLSPAKRGIRPFDKLRANGVEVLENPTSVTES